jgi:hypothetical protein
MAPGAEAGAMIKIACAVMPMFQTPMTPGASPALRAEQQLQSHAHLDADDYARWMSVSTRPRTSAVPIRRCNATHQDRQLLELGITIPDAAMLIATQPGPKDPPTKDGGPIMGFVPERVAAISVAASDAKGTRIASGVTVSR